MKEAALYLKSHEPEASPKLLTSVPKGGLTIGRTKASDVQIDDLRCNNIHALIERNDDGSFNIIDLGSHFGTYKNNVRFEEIKFNIGETFRIGTSTLYIDYPSEPVKIVKEDKKDDSPPPRVKELAIDKTLLQVSLFWGQQSLEVRTFETGSKITIGAQKSAVFNLPLNTSDDNLEPFTLAIYKDSELHLILPVEVHGLVWVGTDTVSVDSLRHRDKSGSEFSGQTTVKLRVGDRAHLEIGELSLDLQFITPSEKLPLFEKKTMDPKLKQIMSGVFGFWAIVLLVMSLWKPPEEEKTLEDVPEHLKKVLFDAGIADAIKKQQSAIGELANNLEGGRARGEEGRATANKSPDAAKAQAKTQEAPKAAAKANAPQVTAKDISSAFSDGASTPTDTTASIVGEKQLGNTASALKGGNFARGTSGFGSGGGGESVGVGQLKGLSTGGGMGAGNYGLAPSKGREVEVPPTEETEILGGLDPEVIANVVRRYLPQVRHCYEQQLTVNPKH
jgi:hypothetical protein